MSKIRNLVRMKPQILGIVKNCDERAMHPSTQSGLCDKFWQISKRKYLYEDILKDLKLTFL
jgi:hypothetical protein